MLKFNNIPRLNQKYLLISLLVIVFAGLFFYFWSKYQKPSIPLSKILSKKEALLILDYGEGKERWFVGEVQEGMTVLGVLKTSSLAGNFSFEADSQVLVIDGLFSTDQKQWRCYLNEKLIEENLSQKFINPQDKILCRYGQ